MYTTPSRILYKNCSYQLGSSPLGKSIEKISSHHVKKWCVVGISQSVHQPFLVCMVLSISGKDK